MLDKMGIRNPVYFNPLKFSEKTRMTSSQHKIKILKNFPEIKVFFEDDPIQVYEIEKHLPNITVVHIVHKLTDKENVRHY